MHHDAVCSCGLPILRVRLRKTTRYTHASTHVNPAPWSRMVLIWGRRCHCADTGSWRRRTGWPCTQARHTTALCVNEKGVFQHRNANTSTTSTQSSVWKRRPSFLKSPSSTNSTRTRSKTQGARTHKPLVRNEKQSYPAMACRTHRHSRCTRRLSCNQHWFCILPQQGAWTKAQGRKGC